MKKIFLLLLMFVWVPVFAVTPSHHRLVHTPMHLDPAIEKMEDAIEWAVSYRDIDAANLLPADQLIVYKAMLAQHKADGTCPWFTLSRPVGFCIANWIGQMRTAYPKEQFPEWNVAYDHIFYANKYDIYATKYVDRVKLYRTKLLAGEPLNEIRTILHSSGMGPGNLESGIWGFIQVEANMAMAVRADSPNLAKVQRVLLFNRTASGVLTWALWHHYDATFDEVYDDITFTCSGVGNPC